MHRSTLLPAWVASLLLFGLGGYQGHAQNFSRAEVLAARAAFEANARQASAATLPNALPSLRDSLEAYDQRRPLRVAVLFVRNLLTDSAQRSAKIVDTCFSLSKPYHPSPFPQDTLAFKLNDEAVLYVRDLRLALRSYKRHKEDLRLYINDVPLPMLPEQLDTTRARNVALVRFRLVRNSTTEPIWQIFYRIYDKLDRHNTSFNVGFADGQLGQAYGPINLLLIDRQLLWVGFGILLVLLGGCGWLIGRSNFIRIDDSLFTPLRDDGSQPGQSVRMPLSISTLYQKVPFSLAKTQTACWTILVAGAYLMITAVTTALPPIPNGLLGLLGISIANGVFSQMLSQSRAETPAALTRQTVDTRESKGWWYDVLNENAGVSLARLQFLVFNGIAGLYFVYYVWTRWAFYDFGSDILALISISSAGFLANKNLENNSKDKDNKQGPAGGSPYTGLTDAGAGTGPPPPAAAGAGGTPRAAPAPAAAVVKAPTGGTAAFAPAPATPPPAAAPAPQPTPTPLEQWRQNLQRFLRFPVRYDSDPTRDFFGNPGPALNGCTLKVALVAALRGGLDLQATVQGNRDPLPSGGVVFLLHPTYEQRALAVPLYDGEASLRFFSVGCFTLIAMLDEGATVLSFDLRDVPGAPSSFLAR